MRLALFLIATLLSAGCTEVIVQNVSALNGRVLIQLPDDPAGVSRHVRSGGVTSTFSTHGGRVTIQTLPEEQYRLLLEQLQSEISTRLFEEGAVLSAEEISRLVANMQDIDQALEQLAREEAVSCTVNAPDFSTVTAYLSYDDFTSKWVLSCSVSGSDEAS